MIKTMHRELTLRVPFEKLIVLLSSERAFYCGYVINTLAINALSLRPSGIRNSEIQACSVHSEFNLIFRIHYGIESGGTFERSQIPQGGRDKHATHRSGVKW